MKAVVEDEKFDNILGSGAGAKIKSILAVRFNLDGTKPKSDGGNARQKVGILDEYQIWCSLVDPYLGILKSVYQWSLCMCRR